jgi:23S rRNA pseudouridine2605 synthase
MAQIDEFDLYLYLYLRHLRHLWKTFSCSLSCLHGRIHRLICPAIALAYSTQPIAYHQAMSESRKTKRTRRAPAKSDRKRSTRSRPPARSSRARTASATLAEPKHEFADDSRGPRLQKVLAEAGVGSRRACEDLIEAGAVRVNGHVVKTLPAWVDPEKDHITVDGRHVRTREQHYYIMLFKPRGVVSTNADPEGRPRAIDLVQHPARPRLYPVGRLDLDSSGLLVMTNDGELANRLTHPRHEVHKVYEVTVEGALEKDEVERLEAGFFLNERRTSKGAKPGSKTARSKLTLVKKDRDRTLLLMELREGRNRQIRRMMTEVGHTVKKLRRVQMGPLKLKGLQPGQWRELTPQELKSLKAAAGLPI